MIASGNADNSLLGTWHLVRWDITYSDGRPASLPFGPDATGLILYSGDGTMNACIARGTSCATQSSRRRAAHSSRFFLSMVNAVCSWQTGGEPIYAAFIRPDTPRACAADRRR